ncbi:septal ring lytic transglycosylase RlpA family protein [Pseudomaricurvus alkylphenolicus]|jgi:rare lipoprotein A|uniref:septal ring lytic transglycosylase RlpA family protein n=1 Tax=Pseudomaricurvus alkylphenolicus TaxID=1306991 RepID=UPI001423015B|nr:septal ring lytic transglycosylase RlpA family protein [Pseudomaricurvus alkylphenolicus]NIB41821.1 septal ring lytic transglycosylase RlpA family protein [Pseudomaricurvus alkylphenolicus]
MSRICLLVAILLLTACGAPDVRDSGPSQPVDVSHIPDAVPRYEERSRAGNHSPYTVLGKTYHLLPDSSGYDERGIASWYGNKFHGRQTSNGELYDMYGMTAAHKTLPIPSYVRVTNLNNGRQVIVRVNDRGPFHEKRIIDLTYAAASKLGFLQQGTAPVRVQVVEPKSSAPASGEVKPSSAGFRLPDNTYLQAGAFSSQEGARRLQAQLTRLTGLPVSIHQSRRDQLYRVRIGPITDNRIMSRLRSDIQSQGLPAPHVIYE